LINPIKAPTYNRHFVANGATVDQGGDKLSAIDSTDILKLEHIDALAAILDDAEFKLQPIKIADDPAANDEPLYLLLITNRQWNTILTATGPTAWRTFIQNAWNRKSYGSKHPLFTGEAGIWNNILMRKMDRAIRMPAGFQTKYCTAAGRATAQEAVVPVNPALGGGFAVDRAMLLGAQALAHVYGKNQTSETYA
ncbi:DUF4043 family protein, partial [Agrobacterium tumefaciens]|uniref:phage capsid family protein n=1 Tax=Agrobacterium tumefaciens TaxID=358 RepID=UPI003BA13614